MIFVIAGGVSDFQKWLKKNNKKDGDAKLITKPEDYVGYSDMQYCYADNYTHSPIWGDRRFNAYARTHNYRQWNP